MVYVPFGLKAAPRATGSLAIAVVQKGSSVFSIISVAEAIKIRSECYRDPLSDPPAPLCGAKPQLRIWGLLLGNYLHTLNPGL